MAWAKNGTPDTLTSTSDTMTISDQTSTKFNVVLSYMTASGQIQTGYRFGNGSIDSGSNYAIRRSYNGGADSTSVSQNALNYFDAANPIFSVVYVINIGTEEKLLMGSLIGQRTAGASNAPARDEIVGKWANTSNQFNNIQNYNAQTGDYNTDSNLSALGSDLTPVSATSIETGSIYIDTDISKRYWFDGSEWNLKPTFEDDFSTNKGWTTTDSSKYNYNSGGWIDFDASSDQTDNRISIDIGTTLSDTAWVMRWKQEITTFAQGSEAQHLSFDIGISDSEVNGATAIGIIKAHHASNSGVNYTNVSGYAVGDGIAYDSYGATPSYPNGHVSGFTPSAKTNWVELKRTGATTVSLAFYTDSTYSTLDGSVKEVTIGSSPTGLRYVMLGSEYAAQIAGSARYTGKFSELKIYNGVTSV